MHFCIHCSNMYYISINEDTTKLEYYCRNCGHINTELDTTEICVLNSNTKDDNAYINNFVNRYTKLDPTLPRVTNILCPNGECDTNTKSSEREIIYIRYNNVDMKYAYVCNTCDQIWKTPNDI